MNRIAKHSFALVLVTALSTGCSEAPDESLEEKADVGRPEWTLIADSADGRQSVYISEESIVRDGDNVRYRSRTTYTEDPYNLVWAESEFEHNCSTSNYRILKSVAERKNGQVLTDEAATEWALIEPGSLDEKLNSFVCDG